MRKPIVLRSVSISDEIDKFMHEVGVNEKLITSMSLYVEFSSIVPTAVMYINSIFKKYSEKRLRLNRTKSVRYRANKTLRVTKEQIRLKEIMSVFEDFRVEHDFQKFIVKIRNVHFYINHHRYSFEYRRSTSALTLIRIDNEKLGVKTKDEQEKLLELLYFTFPCVCNQSWKKVTHCKVGF